MGVITDADFFPDGLAIDPIADMIDALGMVLWRAVHETPVGLQALLGFPDCFAVGLLALGGADTDVYGDFL